MQLTHFLRDKHGIFQPVILIPVSAGSVDCIFCRSQEVPQWGSVPWEPHFYGWGEPVYISLLLFSTLVDYIHGRLVWRFMEEGKQQPGQALCGLLRHHQSGTFRSF